MKKVRPLGCALLLAALLAVSCLVGVRERRAVPVAAGEEAVVSCPPRWLAQADPDFEQAREAMSNLAGDLPEQARALLPQQAVRLSRDCPLSLPIAIVEGRCYLFGIQLIPRGERSLARLSIPDDESDEPRTSTIDHSMTVTFGEGADALCYKDSFQDVVEISTSGQSDLVWVQAYELSVADAREWQRRRREDLAAAAMEAAEESRRQAEARDHCRAFLESMEASDAAPSETDSQDAGIADADTPGFSQDEVDHCRAILGEPSSLAEARDGGADSGDSGDRADGQSEARGPMVTGWGHDPRAESAEEEHDENLSSIPEGQLAIELPSLCEDGQDNDHDGASDCDDPDCSTQCARFLFDRLPWLRVFDVRLGIGYRVAHDDIVASEQFIVDSDSGVPDYEPLQSRWGMSGRSSLVWRFNRFLGVGVDFGVNFLESRAWVVGSHGSQLEVDIFGISLGLSFQASIPVWIMEIGGSIGLGWLHLQTNAQTRSFSGDSSGWHDLAEGDRSFNHPYGGGWLWVDFWIIDSFALGLYGGVQVPLAETTQMVTNDYHVGLRTTIRVGF